MSRGIFAFTFGWIFRQIGKKACVDAWKREAILKEIVSRTKPCYFEGKSYFFQVLLIAVPTSVFNAKYGAVKRSMRAVRERGEIENCLRNDIHFDS